MTRRERLRRVVILCASFARNVAYFRAGQSQTGSAARAPSHACSAFWTQVSANFLDISVLEWCKLLGDERDKHFWRNVVTDPAGFEASLLANLGMTASDFDGLAKKMVGIGTSLSRISTPTRRWTFRRQRLHWTRAVFIMGISLGQKPPRGDLFGLADTSEKFARGYEQCFKEAQRAYGQATAGGNE